LVWYAKEPSEELVGEEKISENYLVDLRNVFNISLNDPMIDCYPVEIGHVDKIQKFVQVNIDLDEYDYFIEAYQ